MTASAPPPAAPDPGRTFTLALALHEAGWLDKAAESYHAVLRARPGHAGALHMLGLICLETGKLVEAAALLRAALLADPRAARVHAALGRAQGGRFDVTAATRSFQRAVALDPGDPDILAPLAALWHWDRRFSAAAAVIGRALALRPGDPVLLRSAAAMLVETRDLTAAEDRLRDALAAEAADADTHKMLGDVLGMLDRHDEALAAYGEAEALAGGRPDVRLAAAATLEALGRADEAAHGLRAAADASPAESLMPIVSRLFALGRTEDAAAVYGRFAAVAADRRRYPGAGARSLTVRPAAALCGEHGWSYRAVQPAQPCRTLGGDGRELVWELPEVFLARVEAAEILPSSHLVAAGGSLVVEGLSTNSRASQAMVPHVVALADDGRALLDLPAPAHAIEEEAILLGGGPNWSHGVLDWASKLAVLERFPELDGLPVLVASGTLRPVVDLFELLGVGRDRMRFIPADAPVRARRLWLPSLTHRFQFASPVHVEFLRRRLDGLLAEGRSRPRRRLYLTRRYAGFRDVVNEAEVLAALAPLGVEAVVPEDHSMAEQIVLFASAELIVGPIGGASAAVAFAPPGAAYLELAHRRIALEQYNLLTGLLGQRFRQLVGPIRGNRGPSEFDYDFAVPPDAVAAAARDLLEHA